MFISRFVKWLFPDTNMKYLKEFAIIVKQINALSESYANFSNVELKNKTNEFKNAFANGKSLDDMLVEAFATVREASKRSIGLYHFDEQLMAGIALYKGMMTEMKTGEGKTLVATLPAYLNSLSNKPVHIATVNDYLAKRDAYDMGRLYSFLGLQCGAILDKMAPFQKKEIYDMDIVYATGSTFGFDYLTDNMVYSIKDVKQRGLSYVILDEADRLIDDGKTPLIISSASENSLDYYYDIVGIVKQLVPEDYDIDFKRRKVVLTESGLRNVDKMMSESNLIEEGYGLYDSERYIYLIHGLNYCLQAELLFRRDVDYIVSDDKILLIDEMTGRILDGRKLSEGMHQAIEAKEGVSLTPETGMGASISYQRYFALYEKFSGMSGTCANEAEEFYDLFKVNTVVIPTHKKVIRIDEEDEMYLTEAEKIDTIIDTMKKAHVKQQPLLIITNSVESSEKYAERFKTEGFKFSMLNAKYHEEESKIIAEAGMPGAITLATNMAGRGTDIQLGGNFDMRIRALRESGLSEAEIQDKSNEIRADIAKAKSVVINAGGLFVIGTERNESRRVDDQARGRAGRQGDPGKSKFYISCDDELLKHNTAVNAYKWLVSPGEPLKDAVFTNHIEKAQRDIEMNNFEYRKYTLKYDLVLDMQRRSIYDFRRKYLEDNKPNIFLDMFIKASLDKFNAISEKFFYFEYMSKMNNIFKVQVNNLEDLKSKIESKKLMLSNNIHYFQYILLNTLDGLWQQHLTQLSYLRDIVSLRGYAEKDPLIEYKIESYKLFDLLLERFRDESLERYFSVDTYVDSNDAKNDNTIDDFFSFNDEHTKNLVEQNLSDGSSNDLQGI